MSGPQPGTPTPWSRYYNAFSISGLSGHVCSTEDEQDTAAIVHRVNNWDALVEAATMALDLLDTIQDEEGHSPSVSIPAYHLRAALKLARGEA